MLLGLFSRLLNPGDPSAMGSWSHYLISQPGCVFGHGFLVSLVDCSTKASLRPQWIVLPYVAAFHLSEVGLVLMHFILVFEASIINYFTGTSDLSDALSPN